VQTFLSFAFVLGVLVFVHELGHFLAAKRVGIKVLKFQLGFNPTIVSFRRGDTEYGIGALPLGGYVKMAGENPDDARTGKSDEFLSKSKWERFQVLIMGPAMNLGLAVILLAVVLYQGAEIPAYEQEPPVIGAVIDGSPAEAAGIQTGDRVLSVSGRSVETWEDFFIAVGTRPNREVPITVLRDGVESTRQVSVGVARERKYGDIGEIGVLPKANPYIRALNPGSAAEKAGLKVKDVIEAVNGEAVAVTTQLQQAIAKHPEETITLTIVRDGVRQQIKATPARDGDSGRLGIQIGEESRIMQPGLFEAMRMSVERNIQMSGLIFQTLAGLITRETSPRQLMGPVAIAQLSGETAQLGWVALFALMANISLNLGLLNLMPIPVLDGGHIAIMALEGVARRDFSIKVKEKMLLAGFVMLMMLMVTVIYNDLTRISWIERLMPWR
jgi:regulator of sigma E protease